MIVKSAHFFTQLFQFTSKVRKEVVIHEIDHTTHTVTNIHLFQPSLVFPFDMNIIKNIIQNWMFVCRKYTFTCFWNFIGLNFACKNTLLISKALNAVDDHNSPYWRVFSVAYKCLNEWSQYFFHTYKLSIEIKHRPY